MLLGAVDVHDAGIDAYRAANATLFDRLRPAAPANVVFHEQLVARVLAAPPQH